MPPAPIPRPLPPLELPGISHLKKRAFLQAFAITGNVSASAATAGVSRRSHSNWLADDEAYQVAFADAREIAVDRLEDEARRRAYDGELEPVFQGGRLVGWKAVKDTTLLIFLLKALRPDKYRERFEHLHEGTITLLDALAGEKVSPKDTA
jgi:hypothetical protein